MSLRHGRSRSSSSIQSANESVFDILESNRCEAAEVEKRLSEVQQWLKKGREHSQSDIEACHVAVRTSLKRLKKMTSSYEQLFERLQAEQLQLRQVKDMELRRKAVEFEEELKFSESEYNKVLMTMSDQFSKKEQDYRELFTNFVRSLNNAQRVWSRTLAEVEAKVRALAEGVLTRFEQDRKHREFYDEIVELVNELNLRNVNDSMISRSQDMSCAAEAEYSPVARNGNRNTIDMSSIQPIEEQDEAGAQAKDVERALRLLTKIGFFTSKNESNVAKMFALAKQLQGDADLTRSPIYPVIVDLLKDNLHHVDQNQSIEQDIIQEESVSLRSALSDRVANMDSIISRHLDIDQLIQPDEDSTRRNRP